MVVFRSLVTSTLRLAATVPMLTQQDQTYLLGGVALWMYVIFYPPSILTLD